MPLVMPDSINNSFVVCGIDPGTNAVGFSRLEIDLVTGNFISLWAGTVLVEKLPDLKGYVEDTHAERTQKLLKLKVAMVQLLKWARPNRMVCESPFYNRLRPGAYAPLVEAIFSIKMSAFEYDCNLQFTTLEPSTIKKAVGAGGIANKDVVKKTVLENELIRNASIVDIDKLDEHAIDAIAVAYSHWKLFLT